MKSPLTEMEKTIKLVGLGSELEDERVIFGYVECKLLNILVKMLRR